jgi:hypothetical protein
LSHCAEEDEETSFEGCSEGFLAGISGVSLKNMLEFLVLLIRVILPLETTNDSTEILGKNFDGNLCNGFTMR